MIKESINKFISSELLNDIVKLWLIAILFIVPFQIEIMNYLRPLSMKLSTIIRLLDEITIVILFPIALQKIFRERIKYKHLFPMLITLTVFSLIGLISGVINMNSIVITSYGIFYYIKYFLLIFIYAIFIKSFNDVNEIFRVLLAMAVIVGFVAFLQEVLALLTRYILEEGVHDRAISTINSIVFNVTQDDLLFNSKNWRMGIYRLSSVMSHYNLLGFYSLFILTIYLYTVKKINYFYLISLLSGIYFSVSRVALAGLIILCIMQAMKGRKWMIMFMIIPMCVFIYSFGTSSEFNLKDKHVMSEYIKNRGPSAGYNMTYRQYARNIAMEIWKDYPFWGVGPGMFGGDIAKRSHSPYYEEYNFSSNLNHYSDLDQFWPQALAETGIIGTIVFFNVYIYILVIIFVYKKLELTVELKNYLAGLGVITIFILINTFASSLNIVSILYPYCALLGMGLGSAIEK